MTIKIFFFALLGTVLTDFFAQENNLSLPMNFIAQTMISRLKISFLSSKIL